MTRHEPSLFGEMLRESLAQGSIPTLKVVSNSMSPLLLSGDEIGLIRVECNLLAPGQLITFSYPDKPWDLITHRIAHTIHENGVLRIVTWSDRTLLFDKQIEFNQVIGKVIWRRRKGHQLSLEYGRGKWLNDKLCTLAGKEIKLLTGFVPTPQADIQSFTQANSILKTNKMKWRFRFGHRVGRLGADLLSFFITSADRIIGGSRAEYAY